MHRSLALGLVAGGIISSLAINTFLGIAFFIAAGFTYFLGARVERED